MKFLVGAKAMRVFAKALRYMAKYSNELFIDAEEDYLSLKVVNIAQTALTETKFEDCYFLTYEISDKPEENKVKVPFRPLLNCVKNHKAISGCRFHVDLDNDRIVITITKESSIEVIHKIPLMEPEELGKVASNSNKSEVSCSPHVFKRLQGNGNEILELHLYFSNQSVLVENYIETEEEDCSSVRLHYTIARAEFHCYEIKQETSLVFAFADFFNIVEMAQQIDATIRIQFTKSGKPIVVILETGSRYSIQMKQMTMSDDLMNGCRKNAKVVKYKERMDTYVHDKGLTMDQEALERVLSPNIEGTNTDKSKFTNEKMDSIIAAVHVPTTMSRKNNDTIILSQQEQQEIESCMRDLAAMEEDDVEMAPVDTPMRNDATPYDSLESYALMANREFRQKMRDQQSENIVPSDIDVTVLSTQDKKDMKKLKNNIINQSQNMLLKVKNAKEIYPGSDSEESFVS